jgi:peptidoglycan/xylan/chitin deacetylase (PgdA/CDA1 family)
MSSLADLPLLIGFFSYSREDDEGSGGKLSKLRERIQEELRAQLGRTSRDFRLWQDKAAITHGELWEETIKKSISESVFFVPIITPTAVRSDYCKIEFEAFLAREKELGRSNLIFPILYISVPALEDQRLWSRDQLLSIIGSRQYEHWQNLRHLDPSSTEVALRVEKLCENICRALHQPWLSPQERQEAEVRQREEEERRQQERLQKADARRGEEEQRKLEEERRRAAKEEERRRRSEPEPQRLLGIGAWGRGRGRSIGGVGALLLLAACIGLWVVWQQAARQPDSSSADTAVTRADEPERPRPIPPVLPPEAAPDIRRADTPKAAAEQVAAQTAEEERLRQAAAAKAEEDRKAREAAAIAVANAQKDRKAQEVAVAASPMLTCSNPNAIGVSRIVEIDTTGGPGFGFEHFKQHDFLRQGEVVLTFDDGPWPKNTPAVLAALQAHCTKAIFFPIGLHATYEPGILKQVAAGGHAIGSHTWCHQDLSKTTGVCNVNGKPQAYTYDPKDEIEKGISAVRWAVGGPTAPYFRFPALRQPPELVEYLGKRNIGIFSADLDSFDFKMRKPEEVRQSVMAKLNKQGKGIVLLHDFQHATAEAALDLLNDLKAGGYKMVFMKPKFPVTTITSYDESIFRTLQR